jgi:glycosyltransferase involved in cell wall biosynthesis
MKILQVYNKPLGTGGEEFVVNRLQALYGPQGEFTTYLFNSSEWTGVDGPPKWKQALWTLYNPQSAQKLREVQNQLQADAWLFHGVFPVGSPSVFREALRQRVPVIQYIHNFRPFSVSSYMPAASLPPLRNVGQTFLREIRTAAWQNSRLKTGMLAAALVLLHMRWLKAVKAWISLSDSMRDKFIEAGIPPASIFTLPYPWLPFKTVPHAIEGNYYLYLGRLSEDKGVKVLCETWNIISQKLRNNAPRLVIGGNGPLADYVTAETKRNPLIEYRGVIAGDEKVRTIAGCRAMLAPSVCWDSRAVVTYEAYDFAKPMLSSTSGGFSETVKQGVTGLLHEPGNATQFAEQIIELNKSAERRRAMGQKGREWLLWQPTPEQWLNNFTQIVKYAQARALVSG